MPDNDFTWRDGDRTIFFGEGAMAAAHDELRDQGWDRYELLTTERALPEIPVQLASHAAAVHHVPAGPVNETSEALIKDVTTPALVAFGGGRVIDTAKAIAAVRGGRVAALPTTLSGAEMTVIHRLPDGHSASHRIRPKLVFAEPLAMTSQEEPQLRASAMNGLAHGADCLYTPGSNPVSKMAALRGAKLIASSLDDGLDEAGRTDLALGAILEAYALDSAGLGLHHVMSQTLVRVMRIPHAETNAAILPRALEALRRRAPKEMAELARALGTRRDDLGSRTEELAGGRRHLGKLGAEESKIELALDTMLDRPELESRVPDPPGRDELRELIQAAW